METKQDVAIVEPEAPLLPDLIVMPAMDITTARRRYEQLTEFVKELMIDGTDFGVVPGSSKPTLFKPGAEKLTTFFGLRPIPRIIEKIEDWTAEVPFFYYHYRMALWRGDVVVAEADGSANSLESKYRWRWVEESEIPPDLDKASLAVRSGTISEFEFAIDKAETSGQYGKPAAYWEGWKSAIADGTARKITRTTRKGKDLPAFEMGGDLYRIPNPDIADQVNTLQKMAQKRALTAVTLVAVNASEFFTQDLEDLQAEPATTASSTLRSGAPKPNGSKVGPNGIGDDPATRYWLAVGESALREDRDAARQLLKECSGDFEKALQVILTQHTLPEDEDVPF